MTRSDSVVPDRVTADWLRGFEQDLEADLKRAAEVVDEMDKAKARGDEGPVNEGDLAWVVEVLKRREELPELRKQADADTAREQVRLSRSRPTSITVTAHATVLVAFVVTLFVSFSMWRLAAAVMVGLGALFLAEASSKWTGVPIAINVVSILLVIVSGLGMYGVLPVYFALVPILTMGMITYLPRPDLSSADGEAPQ
ncbi:hypothetical protein [Kribbella sp. NBC_00359]|uniref:hypothetical protein n=1 Tax=Kribbella sp. NBC_00359 TaxID=2975966 RepID=UPI002E22954C